MPPRPSRRPQRRFDSLRQEAFLNLWRTYDRLRIFEDELFGRYGLTSQQYNILRLLRGQSPEPLATLELAARLVSRAPDITRMLDKLEARGLIERARPRENRRVVEVRISQAGRELLEKLDGPVRACHERQLGHLDDDEVRRLIELLQEARAPHEPEESPWRDQRVESRE